MSIGLNHYLVISALLFVLGMYAMLSRRNVIAVLMGVELILNAANVNFIAFSRYGGINIGGQMASIFVIVIAAAEAAVALAIVLNIYKNFRTVNPSEADTLRD
jgi:NADH-quinone oxidoreductase subunit K